MIRLRNVVVHYPGSGRAAVADVSLQLKAGEKVALVGPSGSGKTTLLRAVNGLVPLTDGSVYFDGLDVTQMRGIALRRLRTRIAMIAQHHDLVDRLRVHQNVMAGALGRWSVAHALRYLVFPLRSELEDASSALSRVGIPQKLHAVTSELSGGERQRVAIARALVQRPDAILADEPVASLDPELGMQIIELLCSLARESGVTLLCSLHQIDFAERYFDRIIRVENGMLVDQPALAIS